jgi:AraC family transcriptional regulator
MIKSFAPLKIKFTLEGGSTMDYKIVEKEAFTVMGVASLFKYEGAKDEIPKFWAEHYQTEKSKTVCGMYGVNIDEQMGGKEFEYLIADNYLPWNEIPEGFVARTIPKHTWAVFPCKGAMPNSMQVVNKKIFSEWLPNCNEYEVGAGYCIEMYSPASDYENGIQDEKYYSEIWIPVKKK